jgi:hypothetical protein
MIRQTCATYAAMRAGFFFVRLRSAMTAFQLCSDVHEGRSVLRPAGFCFGAAGNIGGPRRSRSF